LRLALAVAAAALSFVTAAHAAELNPAAVVYQTPEQFKWADPTDKVATNRTVLYGDPDKPGLYIYINKFKPNRFGNPHYHPNDRFITVSMVRDGKAPARWSIRRMPCGCRKARS